MTAKKENGPPNGPPDGPPDTEKKERLTLEEAKRLVEEMRERGEDPTPIIRRLVLQVIEEVQEDLRAEDEVP